MIFATYWFVVFAVVAAAGYAALIPRLRLPWLLGASLVFHQHFAGAAGMAPIAIVACLTYGVARTGRRDACGLGIVVAVGALCFYKYGHFVAADVVGLVDRGWSVRAVAWIDRVLPATPPLAISFFTFEFVHYLVEVRRGGPPIRHPAEFALFTVFFPSLAAGPIKRYGQFLPALREGVRTVAMNDVAVGLGRVIVGYTKKMVVGDTLGAYLDAEVTHLAEGTLGTRWLFLAFLSIRILADFSGYSDIAIGFARIFGVRLPENFNWPYVATNIQEFWQRWHISLSTWIRDYVYIPLGGNRHGPLRRAANAFIAMTLCGLWHGPAWNFALWGIYHGMGLGVSAYYASALGPVGRKIGWVLARYRPVGWLLTTLFVWFGWLLFFYPVRQAIKIATLLVVP